MGAWDNHEHAGLFSALGGLIVLVFAGIVVSLVTDPDNHEPEPGARRLADTLKAQEGRIHELSLALSRDSARWKAVLPRLNQPAEARRLEETLAALVERRRSLESEVQDQRAKVAAIQKEAEAYRLNYRETTRRAMVGQEFETLVLPDGTRYRDVRITAYDREGFRIRHAHGGARLGFRELPESWKQRLQWDPLEESRTKRTVSAGTPAPAKESPEKEAPPAPGPSETDQERMFRIEDARNRLTRYQADYRDARSEASLARSKAHGPERSVPGSLETWAARAQRMERAAQTARRLYLEARRDLRSLAPNDPLLRDPGL